MMTRTNQILIAVAALVAASCAFYFLALAPKREVIVRLDADIAAKQVEVEAAKQMLVSYEAARAGYKANYAMLARLGKAVPADDDVRSLLVQLESAADRTGVDFQKIELGGGLGGAAAPADAEPAPGELAAAPGSVPVAGGALSAMPFSFGFNGEFFDLASFLAHVERFVTVSNDRIDVTGRLLRLESIQLQPSPSGFPSMQAQIGAATYIVPPAEPVPAAAAGAAPPAGTQAATPAGGTTPPTTTTATATGAP
jgi:Tfp pilus assembly protein PilO